MKIIYEMTKENYDELKNENWFGCENEIQYVLETIIEDPESILNADLEIKIVD